MAYLRICAIWHLTISGNKWAVGFLNTMIYKEPLGFLTTGTLCRFTTTHTKQVVETGIITHFGVGPNNAKMYGDFEGWLPLYTNNSECMKFGFGVIHFMTPVEMDFPRRSTLLEDLPWSTLRWFALASWQPCLPCGVLASGFGDFENGCRRFWRSGPLMNSRNLPPKNPHRDMFLWTLCSSTLRIHVWYIYLHLA